MAKIESIRSDGGNPFAYTYAVTHKTQQLQQQYEQLPAGEEDATAEVAVAGRVMLRRVFGKLAFFTLQDDTGNIQLYLEKGRLGESFASLKQLTDAGDIVGVKGTVKRTEKVGFLHHCID